MPQPEDSSEYKLRKHLLLLATLVVSVTFVAGLNPPGGVWQKDGAGHTAGDPIPRATRHGRYLAFYYCNATALAASLVVIVLLLLLRKPTEVWLSTLRLVMLLDLLGLMGAYLAGSCREKPATVYATALVVSLSAYVGVHILQALNYSPRQERQSDIPDDAAAGVLRPDERRKVLLLLATFATAITYAAGLNPPGGFWDHNDSRKGAYHPGDALVEVHHKGHFSMFFYCNTTAFVGSLFIVVLLLNKKLSMRTRRSVALNVFILGALLGLLGAYAAGSCRDSTSAYVVSLVGAVLAFIVLAMMVILIMRGPRDRLAQQNHTAQTQEETTDRHQVEGNTIARSEYRNTADEASKKVKSLVLLLATLAATITYQAGLNPPGGVWPDDRKGHRAGDPILLTTYAKRYKVFFYCNSTAFVVSLFAILLVQSEKLAESHTLLVAMMLDMFALMGAYAAGSCRDVISSIIVVAVAGGVLVYVVIHVLFFTLGSSDMDDRRVEKKQYKLLLLLAILVATVTYQAGLTPPGGFWLEDDHRAGNAILFYRHPRRFLAFFYCNTTSFMASVALILLLVNPKLYRPAIWCYALYACILAGLFGLMAAYAAGSSRSVRTSIYVFALVAAVIAFIVVHIILFRLHHNADNTSVDRSLPAAGTAPAAPVTRNAQETEYREDVYARRKYLMLLGILAASVTYQGGLSPPGGVWQDDGSSHDAGNPVLHDSSKRRYHVFFYSNSTSFVASVVVIALLLGQILQKHRAKNNELLLLATNTAVVLVLLGLLAAYAAGSTREWENVVALAVLVLLCMAIHVAPWLCSERRRGGGGQANPDRRQPQGGEQVNGHGQTSRGEEVK